MKPKLLITLIFYSTIFFGQKEASQWYFGGFSGLNFLNIPPTSINNGSMATSEGCASLADSVGNLLFYTNGKDVWNKQHNLMAGSLPGHVSSTQAALPVRKSGSLYYIFTTGASGTGNFGYTIIDMQQAAGLGAITSSVNIRNTVSESMAGTMHCNGKDTWVVIHPMSSNNFEAYLAGANSVSTIPVVSSIGPSYNYSFSAWTSIKFSPSGKKMAVALMDSPGTGYNITLYSFNNVTGIVSSPTVLVNYSGNLSQYTEFSPDGTKLYTAVKTYSDPVVDPKFIIQWDLCSTTASALVASGTTVATIPDLGDIGDLQLAIDSKIYYNSYKSVGYIDQPNLAGAACTVVSPTLMLNQNGLASMTLPNYVSNIFRQKASYSASVVCGSASFSIDPITVCASAVNPVNSVEWFFGETGSSTNSTTVNNPTHVYIANGTYTVKMVAHYDCSVDTIYKTIQITALPNLTVTGKTSICQGEKTTYTVSGANSFTWSTTANTNTVSLAPGATTVFTVSGSNQNCSASKQLTLTVKPCTSIREFSSSENEFQIFPNPNAGEFFITCHEECEAKIYDAAGQCLQTLQLNKGTQTLRLNKRLPGIYFLKTSGTVKIYTAKIVVE